MFVLNILILVWVLMLDDFQMFRSFAKLARAFCYSVFDVYGRISINLTAKVYEILDVFYSVVVSCGFAIFL